MLELLYDLDKIKHVTKQIHNNKIKENFTILWYFSCTSHLLNKLCAKIIHNWNALWMDYLKLMVNIVISKSSIGNDYKSFKLILYIVFFWNQFQSVSGSCLIILLSLTRECFESLFNISYSLYTRWPWESYNYLRYLMIESM